MGVIRKTKSVKAILNVFEEKESAVSSISLIKRFENEMNKTTVYRILDRLVDEGLLHTFKGNDGISLFAKADQHSAPQQSDLHPHFQCEKCGETKCVPLEIEVPKLPNFHINSAELLLTGICENCK
jgi:Fur family ferric uptake transcriptional regulator